MSVLSPHLDQIKTLVQDGSMPSRKINHENSVAEHGCTKNTVLVQGRNGDFFGFSVKALEHIKPLFTDKIILDAIELYQSEEFDAIIRLFDSKDELLLYGYPVIDYIILKYLEMNKLKLDQKMKFDFTLPEIDSRMKLTRSDAIISKLEIVNVGNNVVPSEWIGRQFESAEHLHKEIDSLDYRKGKPPVTYCCIYGMSVTEQQIVQLVKNIPMSKKSTIIVELQTNHTASFLPSIATITKSSYVDYENDTHRLIVAFEPIEHFTTTAELTKNSVGLLSSTLQKCIRHGRCGVELLKETVEKLARAKPYNLPEQNYLKVSGSRQLFGGHLLLLSKTFVTTRTPRFCHCLIS